MLYYKYLKVFDTKGTNIISCLVKKNYKISKL